MYNYYINNQKVEEYPKGSPREFRFGETHYIPIIDMVEDESGKVINEIKTLSKALEYYRDKNQAEYERVLAIQEHENRCNPDHEDYNYDYARQFGNKKYDDIKEQIDKFWHDIDQDKILKEGEFYLHRKNVKKDYPG